MHTLRGVDLLVATGNAGKMAEFSHLLAPFGTRLRSLTDLALSEPEETEYSFVGNSRLKARAGALATGLPTLADDSGLVIAELGGAPGLYTADWAESGTGRDFRVAMAKTWGLLQAVRATPPINATFCCVLALIWPDGGEQVFEGRLEGQIVWPMRGSSGHGYDPIFQPAGHARTMGEMNCFEKNQISHRSIAVGKFMQECFT